MRKITMTLPQTVFITEVGPRDGLQMEKRVLGTDTKADLIAALAMAGVPAIQVAAFVHPEKVPQMADAEALIARLPAHERVQYSALALNRKGVERACRTAIPWIEVSLSASEAHSVSNAGMPVQQALAEAGTIATEDTLHLLHSLGIATGIDAARVAAWSRRLSDNFGHPLSGRLYRLL